MDVSAVAPAVDLAAAIRRGDIGSRELLDCLLDRIERFDGPVNSVVTVDADRAREAAERADRERASGDLRGPLHGLPMTVKDAVETAGIRSTAGARELASHVPHADAAAVARLRNAGAIVFGKTNLSVWAGDMQSYNDLFGTTSNPWALDRSPGGSSGGAAAAVAGGLTSFELGTDIGGSIRIPAHLCGTFGLRPSYGLVPQDGYLAGVRRGYGALDLNVVGPLARSARDLELLLDVLAGPNQDDTSAWSLRLPSPPRTYRIGLWLDDPFCPVDTGYVGALTQLADRLADAGAVVEDARPPLSFEEAFEAYWTLMSAANQLNLEDSGLTHREWLEADDTRRRHLAVWRQWFTRFDVLLCPVLAVTDYPHDLGGTYETRRVAVNGQLRTHVDVARWTGLVGALGLPVAVAPIGLSSDGLPLGVQVITDQWHDRTTIGAAGLVADVSGGYRTPPGF